MDNGNVVRMKPDGHGLTKAFLGWQCRLRQLSVRNDEGRPGTGMRPRLQVAGQDAGDITVVIIKRDCESWTSEFRHLVMRTHDPKERFDAALRYFQSSYYQDPSSFDDRITAVFGMAAAIPKQIDGRKDCMLTFSQFGQRFKLPCKAVVLSEGDPEFQATYWHNALFNPTMPAGVQIVSFEPDWNNAQADPPV